VFRDIHRHRILTQEHQRLTTDLGFNIPPELGKIGLDAEYGELMETVSDNFKQIESDMPIQAQYVVPRSFNRRWYMSLNLREVYHIAELRSLKQGHPDYRKLAQQMKMQIGEVHPLLVEHMQVDMKNYGLGKLDSEKRIERQLTKLEQKVRN